MREFVGVVGTRDGIDLRNVEEFVKALPRDTIIVTGTWPDLRPEKFHADGVDERAARTAYAHGMSVIVHPALWRGWTGGGSYSAFAGLYRNSHIVRDSGRIVAFWDGRSTGTRDTIDKAEKAGIPVEVYGPDGKRVR